VQISAADRAAFLDRIRQGDNRKAAAESVGHFGSHFRRLTSPKSAYYDEEFAQAYIAACEERDEKYGDSWEHRAAEPQRTTRQGFIRADYLGEEEIDLFIEQVSNGVPAVHAAQAVGTSMTQINRRAARDKDFDRALEQAKLDGYPVFKDKLRSEAVRLAFTGDYRALRDLLLVHADEYRVLTTQRHEISGPDGEAMRILAQTHLPSLPPELLDQVIEHLERAAIAEESTV
jgi:hypothetical protein